VTGRRAYFDFQPGEIFEAVIDKAQERRGLDRGDITLLEPATHAVNPDSYRLPVGWLKQHEEVH
jgi:hypothetical protein